MSDAVKHGTILIEVDCPDCGGNSGNRQERRERLRQRRKCSFCKGTGKVEKSIPHVPPDMKAAVEGLSHDPGKDNI
jgi:DnaJ-class molecular chaperone